MNLKDKLNTLISEDRKALQLAKENKEKQSERAFKRKQRLNIKGSAESYVK